MRGPTRIFKLASYSKNLLNSAPDRIFERWLDVSTRKPVVEDSAVVVGGTSVLTGGDDCPYSAARWLPVRSALKKLSPGPGDVFVDLGSGKGKVLLIAAQLPFGRVVGIEVDEKLSECARHNIARAKSRLQVQDVDCVTASALNWPIPQETSAVFMYNPFIGDTFRSVMQRIIQSYDRRPRPLRVVYLYPYEHDWLLSTGRVVVDDVRPGDSLARYGWWKTGYVIVSYHIVGASEGNRPYPFRGSFIRSRKAIRYWRRPNGHQFTIDGPGRS